MLTIIKIVGKGLCILFAIPFIIGTMISGIGIIPGLFFGIVPGILALIITMILGAIAFGIIAIGFPEWAQKYQEDLRAKQVIKARRKFLIKKEARGEELTEKEKEDTHEEIEARNEKTLRWLVGDKITDTWMKI